MNSYDEPLRLPECNLRGSSCFFRDAEQTQLGRGSERGDMMHAMNLKNGTFRSWRRPLLVLALFLTLLGSMAALPKGMPNLQPVLLQMASEHPDATLSVIVQKTGPEGRAEEAVVSLGGRISRDLSFIKAFAADVPARAVVELAHLPGIRWISLDAPVTHSACEPCVDTKNLQSEFVKAIGADRLWNVAPYRQGQGVTVAIVDSGIKHKDFGNRVLASVRFISGNSSSTDQFGHGTHIAGIVGGDGQSSKGAYIGVAPKVNLVDVKVSDDQGKSRMSDVVAGLQWVYQNHDRYNIRVVNLSLNSAAYESYHVSPLDAAVEILWFNKIVVVVAAGNVGKNALHPPANDPFVITVGAVDETGALATFSGYGTTGERFSKPDLVAPGVNIVSLLSSNGTTLAKQHRDHVVKNSFMRMSGTSMASAVAAGAIALLIQSNPRLNPDQIKYRLMATSSHPLGTGVAAGRVQVYDAVHSTTTAGANKGTAASQLLWSGGDPVSWNSVNWDSVNWDSVNWDSVNWDSVNWDSVNWDSDYWGK